jgi:eukaryotic-like serine/threonine-protein kinase
MDENDKAQRSPAASAVSHVTPVSDAGVDLTGEVVGERFEILRRLGAGGMGIVYEARDRHRDALVALKTLSRLDPSSIYRMKNEFRALADVVHPNLVRLHELHAAGNLWFFTMDLVRGRPFTEHVRIDSAVAFEDTVALTPDATVPNLAGGVSSSPGAGVLREASLRRALLQLARGVDAIHRAGKIHRDLKPTNVLVTSAGRVVILDFGLVSEQALGGVGQTIADGSLSGTPSYMAPEQCEGAARLTPAADWYAVGVMLFEALTGRLPFEGNVHAVLIGKMRGEAPAPVSIAPGVPEDLNALCVALMRRDASERPDGARILEALEQAVGRSEAPAVSGEASSTLELPFAGRRTELDALENAFRASGSGRPVIALVHGEPGMGKSHLVQRFLSERADSGDAIVLRGRCYERERVPYKLLDGLLDALSRHLRSVDPLAATRLLPRHVHALARMFPVLGRVEVVASTPSRPLPQDPIELRRRGAAALTELLGRMTDEQPVVLYIDDLHWGDLDGARILADVLVADEAPPVLLVATYRPASGRRAHAFGC